MKRGKRSAPVQEEDGEDWEQTRKVNVVNTVTFCPKLCRHDACGLLGKSLGGPQRLPPRSLPVGGG